MLSRSFRLIKSLSKAPLTKFGGGGGHAEFTEELQTNLKTKTMYYSDPEDISFKVAALIAMHENLKTREVKLSSTWHDLGLSDLDRIEIILALEDEFNLSIPEDAYERFKDVYDIVQWLAKSPYIH